jgi:hypothetical protein
MPAIIARDNCPDSKYAATIRRMPETDPAIIDAVLPFHNPITPPQW